MFDSPSLDSVAWNCPLDPSSLYVVTRLSLLLQISPAELKTKEVSFTLNGDNFGVSPQVKLV